MSSDFLVVLTTVADHETGIALSQQLVDERLAACVQVIPGGTAVYRWQDELHAEAQTQLVIKTRRAAWPVLQSRLVALHADEVPELIVLPVLDGLPAYLDWLKEMTVPSFVSTDEEEGESWPTAVWLDYPDVYPRAHHRTAGTVKVLRGLYSLQLNNSRDLLVYLPPSYDRTERRYPVIYMHDGQNLFDSATSFAGEWYVDETMEGIASQGYEAIVVGIPNIGQRRFQEYIPFPAPDLPDAQGELYVDFLADSVKPIIDRDFRTLPGRENTGIAGSSLGGLISLYAFFKRPEAFGLCAAVSPALRWGKQGIFPFVAEAPYTRGKIYLDVGTSEASGLVADPQSQRSFAEHYTRQVRRMNTVLKRKGYHTGDTLLYVEEEGGIHHESAWARRLPGALRFLLGK